MTDGPVWFITGCTTGFGRELAKQVLAKGWRAAVTGRGKDRMADLAQGHEENALLLDLDVAEPDQVQAAVKAALDRFGRIDVLVNNAGYGYQSTIEESDDQAIRDQFEANVFGLFAVTKAVLPSMRAQRSGHVINISSVAGFIGFPGSAFYAASKHAVEGFTDTLRAEGESLGIKATAIEPGPFRTDWAGRSLRQDRSRIDDYAETADNRMGQVSGYSGKQPGDPVRAAAAMIAVAQMDNPPRHLVLGKVGFEGVTRSLRARLEEIERHKDEALAADFPEGWG
ncbi:MAG TPA: oxidoreductase [Caulobacteraceae bacterium]|jgi:NAD(P)-dependent dehydrogenase (short-subunit alcohol dehydrogenase family)